MMVAMSGFRCVVVVNMRVDYCVCMHMPVMEMRVCMLMFMFVAADQRVCCCHSCAGCHDGKSEQVDPRQLLVQENERKERTDEWSNGVIGARLYGTFSRNCSGICQMDRRRYPSIRSSGNSTSR